MLTRIITGAVLIAAVLAWLFLADYPIFTIGALFIYMVGAYEMGPLLGFKSRIPFVCMAAAAACLMFYAAPPGEFVEQDLPGFLSVLVAIGSLVWIIAIPLLLKYPKDTSWHKNKILNCVLGLLMLLPFLEGLLMLRSSQYAQNQYEGSLLVLSVMALVWCADSGAYFVGYFFGKTKMLPAVSPKKTMEGLAGGIVAALIAMVIFLNLNWLSSYGSNLTVIVIASICTILFSVIGDLTESMLKRLAGIKDSGKIFPGHGGMLDRIDSQLAAIPVFLTLNWLLSKVF